MMFCAPVQEASNPASWRDAIDLYRFMQQRNEPTSADVHLLLIRTGAIGAGRA